MISSGLTDMQDTIVASDTEGEKIKVMVVGEKDVGKSMLLKQLMNVEQPNETDRMIMAVDFFIARITMENSQRQKLFVWATAGELKNINMVVPFLRQCHIYIIVFSLSDQRSLQAALDVWFVNCLKNSRKSKAFFIFIGNKSDEERDCFSQRLIEKKIIQTLNDFLRTYSTSSRSSLPEVVNDQLPDKVIYRECSASTGEEIQEVLETLRKAIIELQRKDESNLILYEKEDLRPQSQKRKVTKEEYVSLKPERGCIKESCA